MTKDTAYASSSSFTATVSVSRRASPSRAVLGKPTLPQFTPGTYLAVVAADVTCLLLATSSGHRA